MHITEDLGNAIDSMMDALSFYSDPRNYELENVIKDKGSIGRKAIKKLNVALADEESIKKEEQKVIWNLSESSRI